MWDLGGQSSIRTYWRCYYADTAAIIYVVDASDHDRMPTARAELLAMLAEEELANSKLLVFANKQDLPNAMDEAQVGKAIGLDELRDRQWSIWRCCAKDGTGLNEGLDWYVHTPLCTGSSMHCAIDGAVGHIYVMKASYVMHTHLVNYDVARFKRSLFASASCRGPVS